ncbi:MAG: AraC family transcriptional regulator [Bacteroidetes bacterium]|nr:AraC family transcriptional regulator [Bacteroidota bacterium]MBU1485997.1 AraC family transcriptional regulator [Bacteroidota bacterium]MBU1760637.1 AraC family transcriptional regulator [Bacteroidota bacterium]MBU2376491.1 AraC family transcriptional regulator [Bacteroidota bacterium]
MREIFVRSLPLNEVIANLAESFDTVYFSSCHEYRINIPEEFGNGFIRGVNFHSGFGLIEYSCTFKESLMIHFSVNKIHPLKFIYCSEGSVKHRFEERDHLHLIDQFQNVIVASTSKNGHILVFPRSQKIHLNSLEISRKDFKEKIDCELNHVDSNLKKLFRDLNARNLFFHHGNYSLSMSDCIEKIKNNEYDGFTRKLFLEGKSNEILSIQIKDFEDDRKDEPKRQILRKSEMTQIQKAVQLLKNQLADPMTIKDLAKQVGTNPTKLQEGFRYTFGLTVNNYLNKLRLEYARDQLMIGDLNISEIVVNIGITNKSYFSRLFKTTYHLNPKEFSKQISRNLTVNER